MSTSSAAEGDGGRRLRYLFLDLNSYFASVEQQEVPSYRGKPIIVVPVEADSSFVIAASYEAKAFGVKTGTRIGDAKKMCPGLITVLGRHHLYSEYHDRILEALETVLPVENVHSIDEVSFRLLGDERERDNASKLAFQLKSALTTLVGPAIKCSIGIAPNRFLAKVASDMQKPDGLTILEAADLPDKLFDLALTEYAGINRKMAARLKAAGIFNSRQLLSASESELRSAFGSVVGARWYYLLRGHEVEEERRERQSLGHSHVLPPEFRNLLGCREVMFRLIHKACSRLRASGLHAGEVRFYIKASPSWEATFKISPTQDTLAIDKLMTDNWPSEIHLPMQVGVTFYGLVEQQQVTKSLFDIEPDRTQLSVAVDHLNQKFGKNKVFLGGMERSRNTAEEKIAFQKTHLFKEGKEDPSDR